MNPIYTRALPVSLSAIITSMGTPMMAQHMRKSRIRVIRKPCWLTHHDKSREVVILDISAGWKLTGPRLNQECDPLMLDDTNITSTSSPSTTPYSGIQIPSQSLAGKRNRMMAASPSAVRIQTNCLPARVEKSRMEPASDVWVAAKILAQPMSTSRRYTPISAQSMDFLLC